MFTVKIQTLFTSLLILCTLCNFNHNYFYSTTKSGIASTNINKNNNHPIVSLKAKAGDNINSVIAQLLQAMNKTFTCEINNNIKFEEDVFFNQVPYEEIKQFLSNKYNVVFIENKDSVLVKVIDDAQWITYQIDLPNYGSTMSSSMIQEDNYTIETDLSKDKHWISSNNHKIQKQNENSNYKYLQMDYRIYNSLNIWQEIEENLKVMTKKYFINRNAGMIGVLVDKKHFAIVNSFMERIKAKTKIFLEITIQFWSINNSQEENSTPVYLNGQTIDTIEHLVSNFQYKRRLPATMPNLYNGPQGQNHLSNIILENGEFSIQMRSENKIITMNNQAVFYKNNIQNIRSFKDTGVLMGRNKSQISITKTIKEKYNSGITFYIHPVIKGDNLIQIYFVPIITEEGANNTFYKKSLSSNFVIEPGKTIILGGFTTKKNSLIKKQIPWIGQIPLLGRLFTRKGYKLVIENTVITISAKIREV